MAAAVTRARLVLLVLAAWAGLDATVPVRVRAQANAVAIHHIQGMGPRSPFDGAAVTTSGVVTARVASGIFVQSPDGADDGDPRTSEGIFVFTSAAPAPDLVPGTLVTVTGRVIEFVPAADPLSPPLTEIGGTPRIDVRGFGIRLPEPVEIPGALVSPASRHDALERLEGMRVRVPSMTVVSPTLGSINESTGAVTSNGVFYGVVTGVARPFRESGVDVRSGPPAGAPCCVPVFDSNPERLRVDSDAQPGASALNLATGTVLRDVAGPLDYAFRTYTILPDAGRVPEVVFAPDEAAPPRAPMVSEVTVASLNVQRLFDTTDDPGVSDAVLTPAAFQNRLTRLARYVRRVLRSPDVLAVQEVENLPVLRALAAAINQQALEEGGASPAYEAFLEPGNDPGGIAVGALVKRARLDVLDHHQEGRWAPFVNPVTGREELLNDRPPFVVVVRGPGYAGTRPRLTVVVNHLRSLTGIESATDGARVRAKRAAQAEFLADLVQRRQRIDPFERMLVVGDMNAFDVSDGLVDVVGTIRGVPAPRETVAHPTADRVDPDLTMLSARLPPSERYSYVFDGSAQVLDHALVSRTLAPEVTGFAYARGNADAPEVWRTDPRRVGRVSDHDALLVYLRLGQR